MNNAIEIITGFGGDWFVPSAFRIIPKTIANRTKDVVEIKKKGAILMDEMAMSKLMDELNCKGSINELRFKFMSVDCANRLVESSGNKMVIILIIAYRLYLFVYLLHQECKYCF